MMSEKDEEIVIPSREELLGEAPADEEVGTGEPGDDPLAGYTGDLEMAEKAMSMGWNPDKEAVGDKWVSAEVFLAKGEFLDEVHKLKRAIKNRDKKLDALTAHLEMMRNKDFADREKDIKAKKREAMEMGDYDSVELLDEELDTVKAEKRQAQEETKNDGPPEAYIEWAEENTWYSSDPELTAFADKIAPGIFQTGNGKDLADLYNEVSAEVKARFPEKFGGAKSRPVSAVETARNSTRSTTRQTKSKHSLSDLPEEDRKIAMTLIKTGVMSEEDYLKDYYS